MTLKAGKAPDYRDREQTKIQRRLPSVPHRIETELDVCERGIETNLNAADQSLRVAGKYVKRVIDGELWKKGGYSSLEDWCDRRWGWTRQRAYQIAAGLKILESLPDDLSTIVVNEGQARALVPVKESARPAVVKRAAKSGQPVTAKRITESIKPRERKKKPEPKEPKESREPVVIDIQPEPKPAIKNLITLDIAECLVCETETLCLVKDAVRYCEPCISEAFEKRK